MPKVSVCVITYNQLRYVRECLQSLVDQETDFDFEVIVGDDCSTDGTDSVVREFVARYPGIVRLIVQPHNTGGARNYLEVHAAASGTYVAHVDGDDYALPGKLQAQVDVLDRDQQCNAVWHRVDYFDDAGHFCSGQTADLASFDSGRVTFSDAIRLGFLSVHSSLMYRRSARTALPTDRRVLDMYLTWDLLSKGHGHILDRVLGRYRVAAAGSLTVASQRRVKLLAIEHADEFLLRHPERRRDFLIWALCRALIDAKNLQFTALSFLSLAWRSCAPIHWKDLRSNLQRMRSTQVRWHSEIRAR
ncbi:MAG: glycosyltransferase [Burkholderiaceae bacterium]|nr:glycosyltransferase [Burkholderiaceae bacterium]